MWTEVIEELNEMTKNLNELYFGRWPYYYKYDEYRKLDPLELMEYMLLRTSKSNLPVNIYVDDGGAYVRHKHPLWLYFTNNYSDNPKNILPLTISDNPVIPLGKYKLEISQNDYNKILQFVKDNINILSDFANRKIKRRDFLDGFVAYGLIKSLPLNEMATIMPEETGLPVEIWLDENNLNLPHSPRIKFKSRNDQKITYNFSTMTISDEPEIIYMPKNTNIKQKQIILIKKFVKLNKNLLLQLCRGEIDLDEDFIPNMIMIDKKGNAIYPQNVENNNYKILGKPQFGFTMIKRDDDLFNFKDANEKILLNTHWFNEATPFQRYNNGRICAEVRINNIWYYLYPNGEIREKNK